MAIREADISVLIPTYRYRDKVGRAVDSALASGAGEIIVTDDKSEDGTMELLAGYDDPRLQVSENPTNLGLWENHLSALGHATKPWIKFIQADDYLLPGGLATYARAADEDVSVVWSSPIFVDDETGKESVRFALDAPIRVPRPGIFDICIHQGWLLGSPSHVMLRNDAITRDPLAWRTDISADLVVGSIAATSGDVVLLAPGALAQGVHAGQDAKTQGHGRGLKRMIASIEFLADQDAPELSRFSALWAAMNQKGALRTAVAGALKGNLKPFEALNLLRRLNAQAHAATRYSDGRQTRRSARAWRAHTSRPHDIAALALKAAGIGTAR
ncbi:MAG: glycosyltransferase family 2 protein [Pseudomonadota bacterium]